MKSQLHSNQIADRTADLPGKYPASKKPKIKRSGIKTIQSLMKPNPIYTKFQRSPLENRGIHCHHNCSPSNAKSRQENSRPYLKRNNRCGRLEDGVRDEENQSRDRVSVTFVGLQVVVHASDCGVWPDWLLEAVWLSVGI